MSTQERIDAIKALTEVYRTVNLEIDQAKLILDKIVSLSRGL